MIEAVLVRLDCAEVEQEVQQLVVGDAVEHGPLLGAHLQVLLEFVWVFSITEDL